MKKALHLSFLIYKIGAMVIPTKRVDVWIERDVNCIMYLAQCLALVNIQ